MHAVRGMGAFALACLAATVQAGEDSAATGLEALRGLLPPAVWEHRARLLADAPALDPALVADHSARASSECQGNPHAAARIIWSLTEDWPRGRTAVWVYGYWQGGAARTGLPEGADARGVTVLTIRSRASDGKVGEVRGDDVWIYLPDHEPEEREAEAAAPLRYSWSCLGQADVIAPIGSGPDGSPRWSLREAWIIEFQPASGRPYHHGVYYIDRSSYQPLYAFAYDGTGELREIVWTDGRLFEIGQPAPRADAEGD